MGVSLTAKCRQAGIPVRMRGIVVVSCHEGFSIDVQPQGDTSSAGLLRLRKRCGHSPSCDDWAKWPDARLPQTIDRLFTYNCQSHLAAPPQRNAEGAARA